MIVYIYLQNLYFNLRMIIYLNYFFHCVTYRNTGMIQSMIPGTVF